MIALKDWGKRRFDLQNSRPDSRKIPIVLVYLVLFLASVTRVTTTITAAKNATTNTDDSTQRTANNTRFNRTGNNNCLDRLPIPLLVDHILNPTAFDLSGRDVGAVLSASASLSALTAHIQPAHRFYATIASTHFGLSRDDSAARVSQSFYRCGDLTIDALQALSLHVKSPLSRVSGILTCAAWMIKLVGSTSISSPPFFQYLVNTPHNNPYVNISYIYRHPTYFFPDLPGRIPVAFQIGLVFQTMHIPDTFEGLISLFSFPRGGTVHTALTNEHKCWKLWRALIRHAYFASMIIDISIQGEPMIMAGCLLWCLRFRLTNPPNDAQNSRNRIPIWPFSKSYFRRKAACKAVLKAMTRHSAQINAYRLLATEFATEPIWPNKPELHTFIHRGLIPSVSLSDDEGSLFHVPPYFVGMDDSGINFNQAVWKRKVEDAFDRLRLDLVRGFWFGIIRFHVACNGFNINYTAPEEDQGNTILHRLLHVRTVSDPDLLLDKVALALELGADPVQFNQNGVAPIMYCIFPENRTLLDLIMRIGKPNLNRRASDGVYFVFKLLKHTCSLALFSHLVTQHRMNVDVLHAISGDTVAEFASKVGLGSIAQWTKHDQARRGLSPSLPFPLAWVKRLRAKLPTCFGHDPKASCVQR